MIDLHTHSTASDGILTPRELAFCAAEKKLSAWALTDHDTVAGLYEAAKAAVEAKVNFIPGVELKIAWQTGEFHLLGLALRKNTDELKATVEYLTSCRKTRNQSIVEKMNADGFPFTLEEIENSYSTSQLGRPHFADFIVQKGIARNTQEAFRRFLMHGARWYAPHGGENLETAVEAIKSAGGIPVLAHPMSLYISWGCMEDAMKKIKNAGVEGLEAFHPGARNSECFRLEELARKLGLIVTAGSDFHGKTVRPDRHLGRTAGDRKIDDRFWKDELLPLLGGDFCLEETDWLKKTPAAN